MPGSVPGPEITMVSKIAMFPVLMDSLLREIDIKQILTQINVL